MQRHDQALGQYEKVLFLDASHKQAHYRIGLLLAEAGRYDEAERSYQKAITIDPHFADAHYNLGRVYMKQRKPEQATAEMALFKSMSAYNKEVDNLSRILLYMPGDATSHWELGGVHEKYEQYARALEEYQTALSIRPGFQQAEKSLQRLQAMEVH
jgi:tetratricopeptide (TPR) repeat protein